MPQKPAPQGDSDDGAAMERIEAWYWQYRDTDGQLRVTDRALTAEEVAGYAEAKRVEGSLTLRGDEEDDTAPDVFKTDQLPLDE